jgi:hypothetical protein
MLVQGKVSLWLGTAESKDALREYMKEGWTMEGDVLPSRFAVEHDTGDYDESTREANVRTPSASLDELLARFSYDDVIVPRFQEATGGKIPFVANAVVLLYDYEYTGTPTRTRHGPVSLTYIGTVLYR